MWSITNKSICQTNRETENGCVAKSIIMRNTTFRYTKLIILYEYIKVYIEVNNALNDAHYNQRLYE